MQKYFELKIRWHKSAQLSILCPDGCSIINDIRHYKVIAENVKLHGHLCTEGYSNLLFIDQEERLQIAEMKVIKI